MYNDPIANLLTVIRNATKAQDSSKHRSVSVNASKQLVEIAKILQKHHYIEKYRVNSNNPKKPILEILLSPNSDKPHILGLKRISSPGLRVYAQVDQLPSVLNGFGIAIISTSKGIMTNKEAKKLGLGGEVLAYAW